MHYLIKWARTALRAGIALRAALARTALRAGIALRAIGLGLH